MSVMAWVKSKIGPPKPAGPETVVRTFSPETDRPITEDHLNQIEGGWRIETGGKRTFRLFEIREPGLDRCVVMFRADMRSRGVEQRAYLEMWCHLPGQGDFFSKGFHNAVTGDNEWANYEIPFYLKAGQRPDAIKLNVTFDGPGIVEIRNIEVTATPLR